MKFTGRQACCRYDRVLFETAGELDDARRGRLRHRHRLRRFPLPRQSRNHDPAIGQRLAALFKMPSAWRNSFSAEIQRPELAKRRELRDPGVGDAAVLARSVVSKVHHASQRRHSGVMLASRAPRSGRLIRFGMPTGRPGLRRRPPSRRGRDSSVASSSWKRRQPGVADTAQIVEVQRLQNRGTCRSRTSRCR